MTEGRNGSLCLGQFSTDSRGLERGLGEGLEGYSWDPWTSPEGETCAAPGLRLSLGTPARSLCPVFGQS